MLSSVAFPTLNGHGSQICDRPKVINRREGRQYMQPQWVVDSANFRILVDARLYAPGSIPPPHLSPFVDAEEEGYIPDYLADLRKMQASSMRKACYPTSKDVLASAVLPADLLRY